MIRTIGVSLIAVVVLVASIFLTRNREPEAIPPAADGPKDTALSLEELRQAGF